MRIEKRTVVLKNGEKVTVVSPELGDAEALAAAVGQIFAEDYLNLAAYPEERVLTKEKEVAYIQKTDAEERGFFLIAKKGDAILATCTITSVMGGIKTDHRAVCSVSVAKAYRNLGLGTAIMKEAIKEARALSYEQIELEAVSTNDVAIRLYRNLGFEKIGTIPCAFKEKDGRYQDLDHMMLRL